MTNVARNVAFLTVLLFTATASAQTPWCSNITGNTTWTLAQSPIHVTCDITIGGASTPTLTIEPGVEVICDPGVQITVGYSLNYNDYGGAIQALGTSGSPIVFSSASGEIGDWEGIYFTRESKVGGAVSDFQHCVIEKAGSATYGANIYFYNTSNVTLSDCFVRHSLKRPGFPGGSVM